MMFKKIYRLPEVITMTGLSRSSIYLRISTKNFQNQSRLDAVLLAGPEDSLIAWQAGVMGGSHADS
jgi:predicted DNA-binding transcriptional regulator AlpA